jgi:hypothetical protein
MALDGKLPPNSVICFDAVSRYSRVGVDVEEKLWEVVNAGLDIYFYNSDNRLSNDFDVTQCAICRFICFSGSKAAFTITAGGCCGLWGNWPFVGNFTEFRISMLAPEAPMEHH